MTNQELLRRLAQNLYDDMAETPTPADLKDAWAATRERVLELVWRAE